MVLQSNYRVAMKTTWVNDRLARIMTVRSQSSDFLVSENAFEPNRKIIEHYKAVCEYSVPIQLQLGDSKQLTDQVIYRELRLNVAGSSDYSDYFSEWKKGSVQRL